MLKRKGPTGPISLADVRRFFEPAFFFSDVLGLIQTIGALLGTLLAGLGTTSALFDSRSLPDVGTMLLPIRVVILLIVAMSLGFGLGIMLRRAAESRAEIFGFLSYFLAFIWGCLLVGSAVWVSDTRGIVPQAAFFTLLGLCASVMTALYTMRRFDAVQEAVLQTEADGILIFVLTAAAILALQLAGSV